MRVSSGLSKEQCTKDVRDLKSTHRSSFGCYHSDFAEFDVFLGGLKYEKGIKVAVKLQPKGCVEALEKAVQLISLSL